MSTGAQRIAHALGVIELVAGEDERASVENKLTPQNMQQFGTDLGIGGFRGGIGLFKSNAETFRRNLVRAIVLTQLSQGKLQSPQANTQRDSLLAMDTGQLERQLRNLFPYKPFRGRFAKRSEWEPRNFTDPWSHSNSNYMYVVHSIMGEASKVTEVMSHGASASELEAFNELRGKYMGYATIDAKNPMKKRLMVRFYEQYLGNPNILRHNIISSSVINQTKHATYYPFGFIMRVPAECIYITSSSDVGVANRTADILGELESKQQMQQSKIRSPQKILANTTGHNSDTGYNEVVVVGTSPEGKQVDVIGIFVKTDANGNVFMRNGAVSKDTTGPYVNDEIQKLISKCARDFQLPIVPLVDTSSGASNTPWPFGSLRGKTNAQLPGRARTKSI